MECLRSKEVRIMAGRGGKALLYSVVFLAVLLINCYPANAIPAFARKYGMPCSSCHEGWPKLSYFGQRFKDNGYQMGNDRDALPYSNKRPIGQRRSASRRFRLVRARTRCKSTEATVSAETKRKSRRMDSTGRDSTSIPGACARTLPLRSALLDDPGNFHFESVWARLDNIGGSSWFNIKLGKFELDNLLSEKRILTLTAVSGVYTNYHFQPFSSPGVPQNYIFGIGDNQVGLGTWAIPRMIVPAFLLR